MKRIDAIDHEILQALFRDATQTNKQLAEAVGLAPSSCLERVRRLTNDGVITGTQAHLNLSSLGIHLQALVAVRLSTHPKDWVNSFRDMLLSLPETQSVFHIGGEDDFLVHIAVKDSECLRDFVFRTFTSRKEITHIETTLIFEHQRSTTLPRISNN